LKIFLASDPLPLKGLSVCKEVWIKANITSGEPPEFGRTAQPLVLGSLIKAIRALRDTSTRIFVADSSAVGCDTWRAVEVAGIKEICYANRARFVDLRKRQFIQVEVPDPLLFRTLPVSAPFTSADVFKLNIGKLKTTYGSPVSFCIKNVKGVIPDHDKLQFHLKGLQQALCDLANCVEWDLAILEGLPMSELGRPAGNGPLGICTDPVVLDCFFSAHPTSLYLDSCKPRSFRIKKSSSR
jgi:uncharacterized protein (DUF362 family)